MSRELDHLDEVSSADLILEELQNFGSAETRTVCQAFRSRKHAAINRGGVVSVSTEPALTESFPYDPHYESMIIITDSSSLPREQKQEGPARK